MGTICLSTPPILRCESFNLIQDVVVIIPTAVELVFTTTLVVTNWGAKDKKHLFLVAEGWFYFALALLDMLSQILPAARDSNRIFWILDLVLASACSVPIFFYILFLFLFTYSEIIDTLPRRFQNISKFLLVLFIPAIVALNALSSFLGLSPQLVVNDRKTVATVGFNGPAQQNIWTFFTSITLALLTGYQALNFCYAFYRLLRAFINQRSIEVSSSDKSHLVRGLGWFAGGLKLGAIESVVGFAQIGWGVILTRRILRFLSRAFMVIGLIKGMDTVEDFSWIGDELGGSKKLNRGQSHIRGLISGPRTSTFRRLSAAWSTLQGNGPTNISEDVAEKAVDWYPRRRVTVAYAKGSAPVLQMRFSALGVPVPALVKDNTSGRPLSAPYHRPIASDSFLAKTVSPASAPAAQSHNMIIRPAPTASSVRSVYTEGQASLSRQPSERPSAYSPSGWEDPYAYVDVSRKSSARTTRSNSSTGSTKSSRSSSIKRKPPPVLPAPFTTSDVSVYNADATPLKQMSHEPTQQASRISSPSNTPVSMSAGFSRAQSVGTPNTALTFDDELPAALNTGKSQDLSRNSSLNTGEWLGGDLQHASNRSYTQVDVDAYRQGRASSGVLSMPPDLRERLRDRVESTNSTWLTQSEIDESENVKIEQVISRPVLTRLKSVGNAPRKYTPTPTHVAFPHESVTIEALLMMPSQGIPDRESEEVVEGLRRDSGVLGEEDNHHRRRALRAAEEY